VNPQTLEVEKINTQDEKAVDYVINDIEIIREKQHFEFWQNQEKKLELPELSVVKDARLSNDELWWSEYDANNELPYSLKQFDKTLWRYHKPFSVLGSCQQKFLLQTSDQLVLVENGKAYKLSNPNSIIELHSNNKWQVVVKND